jgi:type III pantothenate kinase
MTMLLVDAGNTRVKWAVAHIDAAPGDWIAHGAVPHAELDSLPAAWLAHAESLPITHAIVANVAGAALAERLAALLPVAQPAWFTAQEELAGLRNRYRHPTQLGADRFAAALGARSLHPGKALVVATCGTATTVDAVSADGEFVGGMILPGLGLMLASLARGTAQLPEASAEGGPDAEAPPLFADNTLDAIRAGCVSAQAGAIERACAALPAELCIVSGGAARHVALALSVPHRIFDNIVLVGLHVAAIAPLRRRA